MTSSACLGCLLVLGMAACERVNTPAKIPTSSCKDRVSALEGWLDDLFSRSNVGLTVHLNASMVALPGAPVLRAHMHTVPVLSLQASAPSDVLTVDGSEVGELSSAEAIRGLRLRLAPLKKVASSRRERLRPLLMAEKKVRWGSVVRLLQSLEAEGLLDIGFLFAIPDPMAAPSRSAMQKKIESLGVARLWDPASRRLPLEETMRRWQELAKDPIWSGCPNLFELPAAQAATPLRTKAAAKRYVGTIVSCGCNLDLASFKSYMYERFYIPACGVIWRKLDSAGGRRVSLRPDMLWERAHRHVVKGQPQQSLAAIAR